MAGRASRLARRLPGVAAGALAALAAPAAALAAGERLTGPTVSGLVIDPSPLLAAGSDPGPGLLLLVAAALGLLGLLSGPATDRHADRPSRHPR